MDEGVERLLAELRHNEEIDRREREERERKRRYFVWFGYQVGETRGDASRVVEIAGKVKDAPSLIRLERVVADSLNIPAMVGYQIVVRNFIVLDEEAV